MNLHNQRRFYKVYSSIVYYSFRTIRSHTNEIMKIVFIVITNNFLPSEDKRLKMKVKVKTK